LNAIHWSFQYDDVSGGVYAVDQGGYLLTREELKDLHEGVLAFLGFHGDDAVEEYNTEIDEKRERRMKEEAEQAKPRRAVPGYVYLICAENGLYKIGKAKDIKKRLNPFSVKFPMEWKLVHSFHSDDYSSAEEELHWQYHDKRAVGEWFKLEHEDVEHITGIQDGQL
jgi:hypothetical protein